MGFSIKTWKNRLAQYPFRRQLTKLFEGVDGNNNPIYVMDVQRAEGTVSEAGDMFSADTMNDLENRISLAFAETLPKLSSMPTASADNVDTQVMYVGATDSNYIKGHCYECRESSGNYSWVHIGVVDVTVDSSLSTTSTNPVENRKITNAVSAALGKIANTDLNNDNKASYPHAKDDWLIYGATENPLFGQCQAAIAAGETFNYGTGGNIANTKVSDVLTQLNSDLKYIKVPAGTYYADGIIAQQGNAANYFMTCHLPFFLNAGNNGITITCTEFRPSGQTAIKDTNPSISPLSFSLNVFTTNSQFSSYVGKLGTAKITISYS